MAKVTITLTDLGEGKFNLDVATDEPVDPVKGHTPAQSAAYHMIQSCMDSENTSPVPDDDKGPLH